MRMAEKPVRVQGVFLSTLAVRLKWMLVILSLIRN